MPIRKKSTVMKSAGKMPASKKPAASGSPAARAAHRSEVTRKLWAYIKKGGLAGGNVHRPIFNTPVQLRNLESADIDRMLSGTKVKLS